ncbi:MAG: hypothetical protein A2Z14_09050 [Chloroflexi bacterium RBG_16_48_8]|nr:MAG: hypothetical protein A2Z14_09050 [Chloroflexi bacterium RBG_16_48_8]
MTHEYIGNLHLHTPYSDGYVNHEDVARAAIRAGLDFVVTTDHNIWVGGIDGYRTMGEDRVLLIVGEEVHDQTRDPQKNHMLIYEAGKELASFAKDPQNLIDEVNKAGGLAFIAHPVDPEAPAFKEPDLSWVSWEVEGYVGLEIWNFMSEFKSLLKSFPKALFYTYKPSQIASEPFPETLSKWDSLLAKGKRVVAIGGADAHAFLIRKGPIRRTLFPYEFHFRTVNTHILTQEPLIGDSEIDRQRIFGAIRRGHCFVGNDLPAPTKGFRFVGIGNQGQISMGNTLRLGFGATLQIKLPLRTTVRLLRNGKEIKRWKHTEVAVYTAKEPGAYRVEAFIPYQGKMRGWIYSNPIYIQ